MAKHMPEILPPPPRPAGAKPYDGPPPPDYQGKPLHFKRPPPRLIRTERGEYAVVKFGDLMRPPYRLVRNEQGEYVVQYVGEFGEP